MKTLVHLLALLLILMMTAMVILSFIVTVIKIRTRERTLAIWKRILDERPEDAVAFYKQIEKGGWL